MTPEQHLVAMLDAVAPFAEHVAALRDEAMDLAPVHRAALQGRESVETSPDADSACYHAQMMLRSVSGGVAWLTQGMDADTEARFVPVWVHLQALLGRDDRGWKVAEVDLDVLGPVLRDWQRRHGVGARTDRLAPPP